MHINGTNYAAGMKLKINALKVEIIVKTNFYDINVMATFLWCAIFENPLPEDLPLSFLKLKSRLCHSLLYLCSLHVHDQARICAIFSHSGASPWLQAFPLDSFASLTMSMYEFVFSL